MNVEFIKISPTQNITLLVLSSVPRVLQPTVASALMRLENDAEQVGFLEPSKLDGAKAHLQMMGGEFCGNATMATGAYLARLNGLCNGKSVAIPLEVSGTSGIIDCTITAKGENFTGTVNMPLPNPVQKRTLQFREKNYEAHCVDMKGIFHIILPSDAFGSNKLAETALKEWSRYFDADAIGILLFDKLNNSIRPLVYVPSTDSLVWEKGCGSGSAAVGCYLAVRSGGSICKEISQPGGTIVVRASTINDLPTELSITGNIFFIGESQQTVVEL